MSMRRVSPAILAVAVLITAPIAGTAQEDDDAFFEVAFDGAWVGTIASGKDRLPLQVMLNLAGNEAIGTIFAFDDTAALTAFTPNFGRVQTKKVTVSYEPVEGTDTGRTKSAATTLVLKYKAADDTLAGNAKGAARGRVALVRMDPDLPVQRLWSASIKVGGETIDVLLQLEETPADSGAGGPGQRAI